MRVDLRERLANPETLRNASISAPRRGVVQQLPNPPLAGWVACVRYQAKNFLGYESGPVARLYVVNRSRIDAVTDNSGICRRLPESEYAAFSL